MSTLLKFNPYLRSAAGLNRMITENARESSYFEGARHLGRKVHRPISSRRRLSVSVKNAV